MNRRHIALLSLYVLFSMASSACSRTYRNVNDLSGLAEALPTGHFSRRAVGFGELKAARGVDSSQGLLWTGSEEGRPDLLWSMNSVHGSADWSGDALVDSSKAGQCRLVAVDTLFHAFWIDRKHRIWHKARGLSASAQWQLMPRIAGDAEGVFDIDAIVTPWGVLLAYLSYPTVNEDSVADSAYISLMAATIGNDGVTTYNKIASFPPMERHSAGLSLVLWKGEVHLFCGITTMVASVDSVAHLDDAFRSRIVHTFLVPPAALWAKPTAVPLDSFKVAIRGTVDQIATAANVDGLYLLASRRGITVLSSRDGRSWSSPVRISPYPVAEPASHERTLAATADSAGLFVTWIDGRLASRKPLASPKTADVFIVGSETKNANVAGLATAVPARLTRADRWPRCVVVQSVGTMKCVYWSELEPLHKGILRYFHNPGIKWARLKSETITGNSR